jgi:hypothetical protein
MVTVQTTTTEGQFLITGTLDTGWTFQKNANTGTTGHSASFAFSSSNSFYTLGSPTFTTPSFIGTERVVTTSYAMSPYTMPANGYLLAQNDANGVYSKITFTVGNTGFNDGGAAGTDLTDLNNFLASLLTGTCSGCGTITAPTFIADVGMPNGGATGTIGFSEVGITATPVPGALPLFLSGLGGLGLLGWRRKRKAQAVA